MSAMGWTICLMILGTVMVFLTAVYYIRRGSLDVFDPFYWVFAIYFVVMVFAPYTWVKEGKIDWYGAVVLENLPVASLYFGLSFLLYFLGSIVKSKGANSTVLPKRAYSLQERNVIRRTAWFMYLIGLLVYSAYLAYRGRSLITALSLGQFGEFSEDLSSKASFWFLNQGTRIVLCASLVLLIFEKRHRLMAILAYVIGFMLILSSGQRNQLMVAVLAPIILYYFHKNKRPKIIKIVAFCLAFVVILGYIGMWRRSFRSGGALEAKSFDEIITAFMVNVEIFFPYYTLLTTVPAYFPHQFGMSYLYTFIQFIPRFIWNSKPVSAVTSVMIAMFGPTRAAWGPAYPNFAEMYLDFGLPGMMVGMYIFARICRKIYSAAILNQEDELGLISFSLFLPYLFQYITRGHFPSIITEVVFLWGTIWVIKLVLHVKWR